jgi:hypothetical protein
MMTREVWKGIDKYKWVIDWMVFYEELGLNIVVRE